jgi:hypothetical protein
MVLTGYVRCFAGKKYLKDFAVDILKLIRVVP